MITAKCFIKYSCDTDEESQEVQSALEAMKMSCTYSPPPFGARMSRAYFVEVTDNLNKVANALVGAKKKK